MPTQDSNTEPDFSELLSPAVRLRSLDDVVDKLRGLMISGSVQPDQRLPSERALSQLLEVSRNTVREALRKLEAQGLVEIRVGGSGGAFFRSPDPHLIGSALSMLLMFQSVTEDELHEYRSDFEQENAELAAERATPLQRTELTALLSTARRLRDDVATDPMELWSQIKRIDFRVHEVLPTLTQNAVRMAISTGIHDALQRSYDRLEPTSASAHQLAAEMVELLELLLAGKGIDARKSMETHLRRWRPTS
jgi:GntR family transcriptional regulator, transcriptional repressor for pyruvate dehydrogenase complex